MFVICTLHNASNNINGVEFEDHKEGKISAEAVSAEVAASFEGIEGYKVVESKDAKPAKTAKTAAAPAAPVEGPADSDAKPATETPEIVDPVVEAANVKAKK